VLLAYEADTAAYFGRLTRARDFSRRAIASADRVAGKETVAGYEVTAALREALFGNAFEARPKSVTYVLGTFCHLCVRVGPLVRLVDARGLEPLTRRLQSTRKFNLSRCFGCA
jgi:hypothetical protein